MIKLIYLIFILSAVYLLQGCAIGGLDLTDERSLRVESNGTVVEIKGDIISITDYPEIHKLIRMVRPCQNY